jgi:hypothetical protein
MLGDHGSQVFDQLVDALRVVVNPPRQQDLATIDEHHGNPVELLGDIDTNSNHQGQPA